MKLVYLKLLAEMDSSGIKLVINYALTIPHPLINQSNTKALRK